MDTEQLLIEAAKKRCKAEIEKAINKVKLGMIPVKPRTKLDEWYRRRYYIEGARVMKHIRPEERPKRRWTKKLHGRKSRHKTFYSENKTNGGDEHDKRFNQNTDS